MGLFNGNSGPSFDDEALKKKARLFGMGAPIDSEMSPNIGPSPMPMAIPKAASTQQNQIPNISAQNPSMQSQDSGHSLKERLFGYSDPVQKDEFGLQKPATDHSGIVGSIMKYALPVLMGGAAGLPGIAAAFAGQKRQDTNQAAQKQALYNTERKEALNSPLGISEQLSKLAPEERENVIKYKHGDDLAKYLGLQEQIRANKTNEGFKAQTTQSEQAQREAQTQKDRIQAQELKYKIDHPSLLQRGSDFVGSIGSSLFGGDTPQQPSAPQPQSAPRPSGAVAVNVSKKDGKKYYIDVNGKSMGLAE